MKKKVTLEEFVKFIEMEKKEKCANCKKKTNIKLKNVDVYCCSSSCLHDLMLEYVE